MISLTTTVETIARNHDTTASQTRLDLFEVQDFQIRMRLGIERA
jgi:hypothetical protein